jgi:hypothetical protein
LSRIFKSRALFVSRQADTSAGNLPPAAIRALFGGQFFFSVFVLAD